MKILIFERFLFGVCSVLLLSCPSFGQSVQPCIISSSVKRPIISAQEGQVQADPQEFFYWLKPHVKQYLPNERWTAHSLTEAYKKAHPMYVGFSTWIATDSAIRSKRKERCSAVPQIVLAAHPNVPVYSAPPTRSDTQIRHPDHRKKELGIAKSSAPLQLRR